MNYLAKLEKATAHLSSNEKLVFTAGAKWALSQLAPIVNAAPPNRPNSRQNTKVVSNINSQNKQA